MWDLKYSNCISLESRCCWGADLMGELLTGQA